MSRKPFFFVWPGCLGLLVACVCSAWAQQPPQRDDRKKDGIFEIILKDTGGRKMQIEELIRDRDLSPSHLYRVKTGGYFGFDEGEWVEKLQYRVYDRPAIETIEYQRFTDLLVEINEKIWRIKQTLGSYDLLALSLMNMGDRSLFASLQSIDENISQQLTIHRKLQLLKSIVINTMNRFVRDRSVRDLYSEYQKSLGLYTKELTKLTDNYERLSRRVMALARELAPAGAQTEGSRNPGKTDE